MNRTKEDKKGTKKYFCFVFRIKIGLKSSEHYIYPIYYQNKTYSNFSYAYQNLILSDKCKVGNDGRNLVQITTTITNTKKRNWSITVYDLR